MPIWGVDATGVEVGFGGVKETVLLGSSVGGRVVPASATRDAWWLTLNSMLGIVHGWVGVEEGMKHGRWCGAGVRLMRISGHGTRQVRWI